MNADAPTRWAQTKSRSPLLRAWRWAARQFHRQALAAEIIAHADLPESITTRIDRITRRTRLWPTERADIARELTTHALDAINAGRDTDAVLTALGDPKTVARLLRRAAKRKRHWLWQLRRWTSNAILGTLGVAILVYMVLFIRFNTGSPEIKRNYMLELNQRVAGIPEDQRAWPAIESLWIEWTKESQRIRPLKDAEREARFRRAYDPNDTKSTVQEWAFDMRWLATPEHVQYEEFIAFMDRISPQIEAVSQAARLPALAGVYSDKSEAHNLDGVDFPLTRMLPPSESAEDNGPLVMVLLPWLGQTRAASNLVLTDAVFAAREGDAERATDRFVAAALLAALAADDQALIAYLVGMANLTLTEQAFLGMLSEQPELFSDAQLATLAHVFANSAQQTQHISLGLERMSFDDTLQRIFTDDGNGDGRLTADGLQNFAHLLYDDNEEVFSFLTAGRETTTPQRLVGPIADLFIASRSKHHALYHDLMDLIEPAFDPKTTAEESMVLAHEFGKQFDQRVIQPGRFPVLDLLLPALGKSIQTALVARAHTDATLLTIAAHLHHRRTGAWPTDASELVPQLLPTLPEDPFNPGQPFKLIVRDGALTVYSFGADGDDDQGTLKPDEDGKIDTRGVRDLSDRYPKPDRTPADITDGDWVIYPPAD